MPHSTTTTTTLGSSKRAPSLNRTNSHLKSVHGDANGDGGAAMMEKFPDYPDTQFPPGSNGAAATWAAIPQKPNGYLNGGSSGAATTDRWQPRRESSQHRAVRWGQQTNGNSITHSHHRQKSLSDAIRTIRTRHGSVSQNAHEIADALKAPVSPKLIILCIMWYTSSALTNTSSKSILNAFDKPATLTLIQFAFVASYCVFFSWLASVFPSLKTTVPALKYAIRYPTREVIVTTLPLAAFQIGGHLLSSTATSKIPVSLVHTIKGLSPLFTVLAYRLVFEIRYPTATYLSLIPLTLGVTLACSGNHAKFGGEMLGVIYALLATIIFVTQNIFSKRLFNEANRAEAEGLGAQSRKLDKLNMLCYSSGLAFLLTTPLWFFSEGIPLLKDFLHDGTVDLSEKPNSFDHGRLTLEFIFNGTFHFGQNIMAFILLSIVSPVTYSVASLIKRVFVIVVAIIWFRSAVTRIQAVGIALTFLGLYLYDRTHESNKADRKARMMAESKEQPLLPLNVNVNTNGSSALSASQAAPVFESPIAATNGGLRPYTNGYSVNVGDDSKKTDELTNGRSRAGTNSAPQWLPPGTRQEDTWRKGDIKVGV